MDKLELADALEEANQKIRSNRDLPQAYLSRGNIFEALGQAEDAMLDIQTALKLDPDLPEAWKNHKRLEAVLEEKFWESEAIQILDQALEDTYDEETVKALAGCEQARSLLPPVAVAYNYLGLILEELGQVQPASDAYRKATQLNPRFPAAWINLGNAMERLEAELYLPYCETAPPEPEEVDEGLDEFELPEQPDPNAPVLQWLYMDRMAYLVPGWPGHRTRQGRSGYDPLEANFDSSHFQGRIFRLLLARKLRTRNPFYLLLMIFVGLIFSFPLIFVFAPSNYFFGVLVSLFFFAPYWIIGPGLLYNVCFSFFNEQPEESQARGETFY